MTSRLRRSSPWISLAAIVFVTVSPIGLRPGDVFSADFDRAAAFALTAALFVLVYPKRWLMIGLVLVVGAGGIELLQLLSPTRHAMATDALVKAAGAVIGVSAGWSFNKSINLSPKAVTVAHRTEQVGKTSTPQIWMTYAEAGEHLGCSPAEARVYAIAHRWSRKRSRDGLSRTKLPEAEMQAFMQSYLKVRLAEMMAPAVAVHDMQGRGSLGWKPTSRKRLDRLTARLLMCRRRWSGRPARLSLSNLERRAIPRCFRADYSPL